MHLKSGFRERTWGALRTDNAICGSIRFMKILSHVGTFSFAFRRTCNLHNWRVFLLKHRRTAHGVESLQPLGGRS